MANIHHVLWHNSLIRIVQLEVLPEGPKFIGFRKGTVEIEPELKELAQELVGDKLPLNVTSECFLVDPPIHPSGTVGLVVVTRSKVKLEGLIVLGEEHVFTGVVKLLSSELRAPADELGQCLVIGLHVVESRDVPLVVLDPFTFDELKQRAVSSREPSDIV